MNKTGIEYLDYTWNPLAMRCTPVSEGCAECWHIKTADRLAMNPNFPDDVRAAYAGEGPPVLVESRLNDPRKVKKPCMIGVQFMGDLFREDVTDYQVSRAFDVMITARQHTFLVLTKKPREMSAYIRLKPLKLFNVPPNVWLGVTAENQKRADGRIPILLQIPAAVHFVSHEPALGPVDWDPYFRCQGCGYTRMDDLINLDHRLCENPTPRIDWLITGGESGPNARPMHPDWARSDRDQCQAAGVPFFFKQWGEWVPWITRDEYTEQNPCEFINPDGSTGWIAGDFGNGIITNCSTNYDPEKSAPISCVGKKAAGRLLDGRVWAEMPFRDSVAQRTP